MVLNVYMKVYISHWGNHFSAQEKRTKVETRMIYVHANIQMITEYRKRKYLESRARQSQTGQCNTAELSNQVC